FGKHCSALHQGTSIQRPVGDLRRHSICWSSMEKNKRKKGDDHKEGPCGDDSREIFA
ncbi:unnamed protein product, partial [Bubo scandiacus]